jgi:ADP-heptose:LPS heptosyltransferase
MKITIGSPDGLGDFVLRMPLLENLLSAGHKLQLLMRPPAADLARDLFPEIEVVVVQNDPFRLETKTMRDPFGGDLKAINSFRPDIYIAGSFHPTFLDEIFIQQRPVATKVAGLVSADDFWPSDTSVDPHELARSLNITVQVPAELPEGEKNLRLAAAILGNKAVKKTSPRSPTTAALSEAKALISKHGLEARKFVVVCAGSRPGLVMKDWGEANWLKFMAALEPNERRAFVFLGNPKEAESIERLRRAMPPGIQSISLAAEPPAVPVSYALVSMASAYLGRDSGVMHMAAASDRPILAVFSGAHWPRFLPEARRGIVLTCKAPCRGCGFFCPFSEPWCATSVPVGEVLAAWRELGTTQTLQVRELEPAPRWIDEIRKHDVADYKVRNCRARVEQLRTLRPKSFLGRVGSLLGKGKR